MILQNLSSVLYIYCLLFLGLKSDSVFLNNGDSRVIWLGDLNYRIALSYSDTRKLLEGNDWDALLGKDQVVGSYTLKF